MCNQCPDPDNWFSTHDIEGHSELGWGPAVHLRLQRHVRSGAKSRTAIGGKAVLLLHGGSANHRTFTIENKLADCLIDAGYDPWLLDWRGSSLVSDCTDNDATLKNHSEIYNFNTAAHEDVPAAIAIMRGKKYRVEGPIALLGHCMGAAVIAEAVACGAIRHEIDRIVLLALGLFYEAAIDSRVKSEERILERLLLDVANIPCIDPRVKANFAPPKRWPTDLEELYNAWPAGLRAHHESDQLLTVGVDMCNRISFMYGMPYRHDNLDADLHKPDFLPYHFGGFPLQMYLHAARNLRAGQATPFVSTDPPIVSDDARDLFLDLVKVTLITGESNRLWHRDSIDRMHEWLSRGDSRALQKVSKHVLPNYAHQDLLWGTNSAKDVYPRIVDGLGPSDGPPGRSTFTAVNQTAP